MLNGPAKTRLLMAGAAAALLSTAAAVAIFFGWFGGSADSASVDREQVALGSRIYAERCASCHGAKLEGQPNWQERKPDGKLPAPPHDASGHSWHHPDQILIAITRDGLGPYAPPGYRSDMPAFADVISPAETAAVIEHIKSAWPEEIRNRQAALTRSYEEKEE